MIDFHAHILPGMDDGSKNPEESARLLRALREQGVDKVIATPHFYANKEDPDTFLQRRETAWNAIDYDSQTMPEVVLGTEVSYFSGLCHSKELHKLCVTGTRLLLIEMPFRSWTSREVASVCALQSWHGILPILAHVERYRKRGQFLTYRKQLARQGLCFQCNAEFFLQRWDKIQALRWLKHGEIHMLGSDCHNMDSRPPELGQAAQMIQKKCGQRTLDRLDTIAQELLDFF